jgi:hypothetical protein
LAFTAITLTVLLAPGIFLKRLRRGQGDDFLQSTVNGKQEQQPLQQAAKPYAREHRNNSTKAEYVYGVNSCATAR